MACTAGSTTCSSEFTDCFWDVLAGQEPPNIDRRQWYHYMLYDGTVKTRKTNAWWGRAGELSASVWDRDAALAPAASPNAGACAGAADAALPALSAAVSVTAIALVVAMTGMMVAADATRKFPATSLISSFRNPQQLCCQCRCLNAHGI